MKDQIGEALRNDEDTIWGATGIAYSHLVDRYSFAFGQRDEKSLVAVFSHKFMFRVGFANFWSKKQRTGK
ncbi:MAG: hypothetical protein GX962_04030 [Epulopiscium sp.]|nr:hypothetical protein [Candidatus Epulonipiscium sp.]